MVDFVIPNARVLRSLLILCSVALSACATNQGEQHRENCQHPQRLDAALADCSRAIDAFPQDSRLYVLRGNVYDDLGQPDLALADYNSAIRVNPLSAFAYRNRSVFYYRRNSFDQAFLDADAAVKLDPKYPLAYLSRRCALNRLGRADEAAEDQTVYERLANRQPPSCP